MESKQLLIAVILPGLITAGLALGAAWPPWRRRAVRAGWLRGGYWGGPIAVGGALVASFLIIVGRPELPPTERWHWLVIMTASATLIALVLALMKRPTRIVRRTALLIAAAAAMLMLRPPPSVDNPWVCRAVTAGTILLLGLALDGLALRRTGPRLPLVLAITFFGVALTLMWSANATMALIASAVGVALMTAAVVAAINPALSLGNGTTIVASVQIATLLALGFMYDYGDVPLPAFLLLAAAPASCWLGEAPGIRRWRSWVVTTVLALCAAALIGAVNLPFFRESWQTFVEASRD